MRFQDFLLQILHIDWNYDAILFPLYPLPDLFDILLDVDIWVFVPFTEIPNLVEHTDVLLEHLCDFGSMLSEHIAVHQYYLYGWI